MKSMPEIELPPKVGGSAVAVIPESDASLPAQADATAILAMIERAARDPSVDIDKMERLVQMQERVLKRNAEQAFNESMKAAQEDMPRVVRDAANSSTNSKYARLETVAKAINPIVTRHGFSMSFGTAESPLPAHYRVTCLVSHIGGHSRDYFADVPSDMTGMKGTQNKTATHAFGSTMSYGRRYLTLLIFNVALVNEDDDGNRASGGATIDDAQVQEISDLLTKTKSNLGLFLKTIKLDGLAQIRADKFDAAIKLITDTAQKRAAREKGQQ